MGAMNVISRGSLADAPPGSPLPSDSLEDEVVTDLLQRLMVALSADDGLPYKTMRLSAVGAKRPRRGVDRFLDIEFSCGDDPEFPLAACCTLSAALTEAQYTAFRRRNIYPSLDRHAWSLTHFDCDTDYCAIDTVPAAVHAWTALARLYDPSLERDDPSWALAHPHIGRLDDAGRCLVCKMFVRPPVTIYCRNEPCEAVLAAFVAFSVALWAIKQLLPADIAFSVGDVMSRWVVGLQQAIVTSFCFAGETGQPLS